MKKMRTLKGLATAKTARGFSLLELSMVLIVIGLILGAVSIGKTVHRNAMYQRIAVEFIGGWMLAYSAYGSVPGDNAATPTGCVNGSCATSSSPGTKLCDDDLRRVMLQAGIGIPPGRSEGRETRYVYLDSNGIPQELKVCFQSVWWSKETGATPPAYTPGPVNAMIVTELTPALAGYIDQNIDTYIDARFGTVRERSWAADTTNNTSQPWSIDETQGRGGTVMQDENQVAVVEAYINMQP